MAFNLRIARDDADRRLLESFKAGDTARQNPRHPGEWLVSSKTHSSDTIKVSYRVTLDDGVVHNSCGCKGFQFRGMCRHLVRAHWEQHKLGKKNRREVVSHDVARAEAALSEVQALVA